MSAKAFFDTNVLVYTLDGQAGAKQRRAFEVLAQTPRESSVISYQVVQEFCNVCLRKLAPTPRPERIRALVLAMYDQFDVVGWSPVLVPSALELVYRYRLSWYDSLIVAAATEAECEVLYSEDLQHGMRIGDLAVTNPFA